jgi:alpha-galactosidase/6-phospho-beta-glucosidase family protein
MIASMKSSNTVSSAAPILTIVGAGSLNWGRHIVVDMMLNPDLAGAEIRLVDLNEHRLAMVLEWCEFARRRLGYNHKISAHTDLKEGLRGATACLTAISVGGDRLWRYDSTHPQLDGIFQAVGDTTGPGGAVRALRHAPVMRGIAQTLAEVGAPNALLLQLTNPLNALTACIDHIPGIRVYGFCHGYHDTEHRIALSLGLIPLHASWTSEWRKNIPVIRVELAGNNHFVFADKLQIGERTYTQKEIHELTPQIFDGPFREAVWSRYRVYVGNNARHPIEFLPGFNDRKNDFGRRWGVSPVAGEIDPLHGERHDDSEVLLQGALNEARQDFNATESWNLRHSHEPIAEILGAFHTGKRFDVHLNLRNEGAIQGVANDQHLEMYCRIENGEVIRPSVRFPDAITAEIARVGQSQLLLARCCDRYDEELLIESMKLDALMPKDEAVIRRLMREMVDFQRDLIFLGN